MAGARHFFGRGTSSDEQLKSEIQADVAAARGAQRDLTAAGQYGPRPAWVRPPTRPWTRSTT
ncbi:hypothetical protein [Streptomyces sp. NPDC086519]|uniref:hypothetical protein n=1 Tax=Streptomyces sp. NPDC086519 TaxID=3154863 RepID=UPI003439927E